MLNSEQIRKSCGNLGNKGQYWKGTRTPLGHRQIYVRSTYSNSGILVFLSKDFAVLQ